MTAQPKIIAAVFASGQGSNLENILRYASSCPDKISVPLVVCNKEGIGAIAKAELYGVPCLVLPVKRQSYASYQEARLAQECEIIEHLKKNNVQWILLAGYMQIISPYFLSQFFDPVRHVNRVVNIHPSLLPAFAGRDGYGDAWRAGVKEAGITLHFVDEGVDTGPIILQKRFSKREDDTFESFRARGLQLEHQAYIEFLEQLTSQGKE